MTAKEPLFEALIVPHRSLTRRGLIWIVTAVSGLSLLIGARFWMMGAWPVLPFSLAESALVLIMLRLNVRQARAREVLVLSDTELTIARTEPSGRQRRKTLPAGWLSVALEEREGRVPRLTLHGHGIHEEIGRVLGEDAKRDLATRLRTALYRARNPVFDNPQLRE